jgi:glycosyl hydrolase family 16
MLPPIPLIAAVMVVLLSAFGTPSTAPAPAVLPVEAVLNGSAAVNLDGWTTRADQGTVAIERFSGRAGAPKSTGVRLSAGGKTGDWAFAMVAIHPGFFEPGKYYRMTAYMRDLKGKGRAYGLLLANAQYGDQPTKITEYGKPTNTQWVQVTRTFIATSAGGSGTGVYLELPSTGSFQVEVTGVSVQRVNPPLPPRVAAGTAATTRVTFAGKAGSPPDPDIWNHETGGGGWSHGEPQIYTASTKNSRLNGKGGLEITVRKDGSTYTSARLNSKGGMTVKSGSYLEAKVTGPSGQGVWPAVWLIGTNIDEVGWPRSGEMDVYEASGGTPNIARTAVHLPTAANPSKERAYGWAEAESPTDLGEPADAAPHLYGVYFSGKLIRFYVDRKPAMTIWASDALATGRLWPFGKSMYLVMNIAIAPNVDYSQTVFPRTMTIHAINVWAGGIPF